MATTNIIQLTKSLCKVYKGETNNPYTPFDVPDNEWAKEYLKFNIWDAEYSVVHDFNNWYEVWRWQHNNATIDSKQERAEEVYKLAISDKLRKMQRKDIDFQAMYFAL